MTAQRREVVFSRGLWLLLGVAALGYGLYWLRGVLTPVFLAFTIAYILDPVVDRFEALRIPRALGIVIVLSAALGAIALFLTLVLPSIAVDVATVASELPRHAQDALSDVERWLAGRGVSMPHSVSEWIERFGGQAEAAAGALVASAGGALGWLIGGTASILESIVAWLIVPIFAVYLLNDFDRITAAVDQLIPPRYRETVQSYAREIDQVLSQFMRGQLTVMLALAVLYGVSYSLLGVRLAVPIGIAAGVLNFIPYLGGAFALSAGLLMSLLGGFHPQQLLGVVVAYVIVQLLEGFFITPRVVGKTVGLREVWVLFALFVGGEAFGFLGVLLAVPVAAVAKIFVLRALDTYKRSAWFEVPTEPSPPNE
ncbi:MAG: AI-2E family transporter [Polyangiaceae bacterium]